MDWDRPAGEARTQDEGRATVTPRVDAILAGAARAFSRDGFAAASMRQIAQESGASLGSIYYHFESKEEILRALICDNFERVLSTARERLEGVEDPARQVALFIDNHVRFFGDHLEEMRVISHELDTLEGAAGDEVAGLRRAYFSEALGILTRLRPDLPHEEVRVRALCLFGMLNWTYRWYHSVDPRVGPEGLAVRMTDLFLRGFEEPDTPGE
jgi:AcrR family transcriptional regulator